MGAGSLRDSDPSGGEGDLSKKKAVYRTSRPQELKSTRDTAIWSNKKSKVIGGHFWPVHLQENKSRTLIGCILGGKECDGQLARLRPERLRMRLRALSVCQN